MSRLLSAPSIVVNNQNVKIKPNTFKYKRGKGDAIVRVESSGGGKTSTVFARNLDTAKGSFSFSLEPTTSNDAIVDTWQDNDNNNVVQVFDNIENVTKTFTRAVIITDPERAWSVDGEIAVEFESDKAS